MMREVAVGEHKYRIKRPKASRGLRAARIVKELSGEWETIRDELTRFMRDYEQKHAATITRDEALERAARAGREAERATGTEHDEWVAVRDAWQDKLDGPLKEQTEVRLPVDVPPIDVAMHALQFVVEPFEKQAARLLALMVMEQGDFVEARDDGDLDAELDRLGRKLLDEGELGEIAELVLATWDVLAEQFRSDGRLGKVAEWFGWKFPTPETSQETPTTRTSSGTSSTTSPPPTGGGEERSSTGSPTEKPLASTAA